MVYVCHPSDFSSAVHISEAIRDSDDGDYGLQNGGMDLMADKTIIAKQSSGSRARRRGIRLEQRKDQRSWEIFPTLAPSSLWLFLERRLSRLSKVANAGIGDYGGDCGLSWISE